MTLNNPLISIIVPCYNQGRYLDDCLASVMAQSYTNWECIIVNDGSPDNTEEIAKNWLIKDTRFKYLYKENGGLSSARNAGLELGMGEWVQFLDCDDLLDANKLAESSPYFTSLDLIITDFTCFDDSGLIPAYCNYTDRLITRETIILDWDLEFTIPIHAGLFRKKYISAFDPSLGAKEDWLFWIEYLQLTSLSIVIPKKLVSYRMHGNSMSRNVEHMNNNELKVYKKILSLLDVEMKENFFVSRILYKDKVLMNLQHEIIRIHNSKGQQFLDFFRKIKSSILRS